MYLRDLNEPNDERLEQAARAILAAVYDPNSTQANWGDIHQLSRLSYDRLMRIAAMAVANVRAQTQPGEVPSGDIQEIDSTIFNPTPSHREPARQ
jgi:hypothetical protein